MLLHFHIEVSWIAKRQFYGDGERPIIGLVPAVEEGNKAAEQQAAEGESTTE